MPNAPADSSTDAPHAPLRQRRKAARPQELLEAALSQFVTKGLAATRMDDVARLAGVSKGTLYLYYASKEELFKAVVRDALGLVIAEGSEIVDRWEGSTADLLNQLAHTWWTRIGASKASGIFKLVVAEVGNIPELAKFYVDEVIVPSHVLLGRAVQRGIDRKEFRQMDVTAVVHALAATAQFLALYEHCVGNCPDNPFPLEPETFMQTQIQLLLHGLQMPSPALPKGTP